MHRILTFVLFCEVPVIPAIIEFVAMGDWGYSGTSFTTTMDSMHSQCPNRDFVLLLGDKYPRGFEATTDADWSLFTDGVARGSSVIHHVVLGNHDYMSNPQAQLDFSRQDQRWDLPSKYYRRTHSDGSVNVCIIGIDTNIFDETQATWLEGQFSDPECDADKAWVVVMGHHPIWSGAMYRNTTNLVDNLLPILHKYKVDLYLAGHDHVHQVFYDGQLTSIVTGAVSIMRAPVTFAENNYQIWGVSGYNVEGYAKIVASSSDLNVQIIAARTNRIFQQFSLAKNGTRESMFGHIKWNRLDSNKDAAVAANDYPKSISQFGSANHFLILIIIIVFVVL